jgi:BASS family bile acid:Na+ symporter
MNLQTLIMLVFQASILLTVFGFGLRATTDDLLYVARRPRLLARSLLSMFVVMPIVSAFMVVTFNLPRTTEIELIALAISAVPPLLPGKETRAGGRRSYGLGLMLTIAALSLVIIPTATYILGWYLGRSLASTEGVVARLVVRMLVLPIVAGMVVRLVLPGVAQRIEAFVVPITNVLIAGAALVLLVGTSGAIWELVGDGTVLAMAVFVLVGLAVGHILGGPEKDQSVVLALSTACRHPGMAVGIAAANRPDLNFGPTVLLYLLVSALICFPYVVYQGGSQPFLPNAGSPPRRL